MSSPSSPSSYDSDDGRVPYVSAILTNPPVNEKNRIDNKEFQVFQKSGANFKELTPRYMKSVIIEQMEKYKNQLQESDTYEEKLDKIILELNKPTKGGKRQKSKRYRKSKKQRKTKTKTKRRVRRS